MRADETSRFRRFLHSDGTRGGGWLRWALVAHAMLVAGAIAAATSDTPVDVLTSTGVLVVGFLGSVSFWIVTRRTWKRTADPAYASSAEEGVRE